MSCPSTRHESFVDGKHERVEQAETVPVTLWFAPGAEGTPQPVVRIVLETAGDRRFVLEYGVDGATLRSTVQLEGA